MVDSADYSQAIFSFSEFLFSLRAQHGCRVPLPGEAMTARIPREAVVDCYVSKHPDFQQFAAALEALMEETVLVDKAKWNSKLAAI
jgi:hypothetical protein